MSKWPFVTREIDGVERKVFTITCAESGEEFEHVQLGRGRPPVFSPEVRARRAAEKAPQTPRRENAMLRIEPVEDEEPQPGDIVVRLTHGMKRDGALRWLTPVRLLSVEGETATVERKGETLTTKFANLVKVRPTA